MTTDRDIIHLDMDAFYASVEVLDNPDLRGRPVIVGGTRGRGVVSAASYEAREFGVHSAQPVATARRLCPHGVFLPVRMKRYKQVSDHIFEIFRRFTPLVEPLSLDEAFLDVTGSRRLFGGPVEIAEEIRRLVREEIGLTVSAGVAPSKMVAKIASDMNKPDGLTVVPPGRVREFLDGLPIGRLWGVGRATRKALGLLGVETFGDLARIPAEVLERKFGRHGVQLAWLARGVDDREVEPDREVKSIGAEETMLEDITRPDQARRELLWLATRVTRRLRRHGFFCRTVTLKVKYSDFRLVTRAETLPRATDEAREVYQTVRRLLSKTMAGREPVRLLGISLSGLLVEGEERQGSLFEVMEEEKRDKVRDLDRALDRISEKYGEKCVLPATLFEDKEED
ncbi:MAG: DNA polymerase IV [Thermodesulfobacteriota bacterium]